MKHHETTSDNRTSVELRKQFKSQLQTEYCQKNNPEQTRTTERTKTTWIKGANLTLPKTNENNLTIWTNSRQLETAWTIKAHPNATPNNPKQPTHPKAAKKQPKTAVLEWMPAFERIDESFGCQVRRVWAGDWPGSTCVIPCWSHWTPLYKTTSFGSWSAPRCRILSLSCMVIRSSAKTETS